MTSLKLDRREFLLASAMGAAGIVLAACTQEAAPTAAPEAEAEAVATATPAAATATPRPTNTPIPTLEATATPVPTAAVETKEAPDLAAKVQSGELPALADRLPKVPLTLGCLHGIGKYGGRLRTFHTNLGSGTIEMMYGHSPLRWIDDGLGISQGLCDTWEANDDNTEWTIHIREGVRWSDGEPCTVDDVLFWWNDLVLNLDFSDTVPDFGTAGGEIVDITKIDDYTLKFNYARPAPLTAKRLAMWVNAGNGPRFIAPKHYCEQFHPDYSSAVTDMADLEEKIIWRQNPDCPCLAAWYCAQFDPGSQRVWERNPYYYCVDTEGNQLPYINGIDEKMIQDKEVQVLTILQGGIDYLAHTNHSCGLSDLSTLKEGEQAGNYVQLLYDGGSGTSHYYFHNFDTPDDAKRELYRNPDFKRAMGHCMDRPTIQSVIYFGTGELTSGTMSPKALEFNYNDEARAMYAKWRDMFIEYDLVKAASLLDGIGVVDVDGDGWREMPDGSPLEIRIDYPSSMNTDNVKGLEICTKGWNEVGLQIVNNPMPDSEFDTFWQQGKGEVRTGWEIGDGPDCLVYPSWLVPNEPSRWAPLCGNRYVYIDTEKEDTELDVSPWDRTPPRWASTDVGFADTVVPGMQEKLDLALEEPDAMVRMQLVWDLINTHVDQGGFGMGTVANTVRQYYAHKDLINVPRREDLKTGGFANPWIVPHPALHNPETFSWS